MKKIYLYGITACMGFALMACDNYKEPNPPAQTNPQESILKNEDVKVTGDVTTSVYDLEELNNSNSNIVLATVNCDVLPTGYTFGADAEISVDNFTNAYPVKASVVDGEELNTYEVVVAPDDLQGVYVDHISKSQSAKEIEIRFQLTTVSGSQVAYVGSADSFYGPYKMTVKPMPSDLIIEQAYYILGTINDWSVADAVKFSHSDTDVYEDPIFTLEVDITEDQAAEGWWWKIIPQSTFAAGDWVDADYSQYGVAENGDEALQGMLVAKKNGEDPGAGCIKEAGHFIITINMEEVNYNFTLVPPVSFLYTPGAANNWTFENSQVLSSTDQINFAGYANISSEGFKFTSQPNWDGVNYGFETFEGEENGYLNGTLSTDGGAGNIEPEKSGLYYCKVNIEDLTFGLYSVTTIGVIGDATPNGWDASSALTPSEDNLVWTGDIYLTSGEFKFRANDAWDVNLGGSMNDLTQGGDNIKFDMEEATYTVTLYLNAYPYSCTLEKK